jgi:ribokinase
VSGRVVVVGSVNADLVVRGERLPRPGETVGGGTFERHQGGKGGNQAVAAARLGRPTVLIGVVGDDELGMEARAALRGEGVDVSGLATVRGQPTGVALILVDARGENLISVAPGASLSLTSAVVAGSMARLGSLAGDVVVVSREIPVDAVVAALEAARAAGARTMLDPAPAEGIGVDELRLADILTPNQSELLATAGAAGDKGVERAAQATPEVVARQLLTRAPIAEAIVVTLGSRGALLVEAGGQPPVAIRGLAVSAVDATGAGDAFNGALAAGLAEGRPLLDAVRRAVVAAGLSTTVAGARGGMASSTELERALADRA